MGEALRCRLCDASLTVGLVATGRRHCCPSATPLVGPCPEHGPLGPHQVIDREQGN